jgi:hypothetical protein
LGDLHSRTFPEWVFSEVHFQDPVWDLLLTPLWPD